MMYSVVLSLHVVACLLVILVVLIQSGKGAGMGGLFSGGGGDALFSAPSGSSFIRKVTTGFAITFFVTSLLLTYLGARRGMQSVTQNLYMPPPAAPAAAPATPPAPKSAPSAAAPAPAQKK